MAVNEQLYRSRQAPDVDEWGKATQRRIHSADGLWQRCPMSHTFPGTWETDHIFPGTVFWIIKFCEAEPFSTSREQSASLNTEIDDIYDQLAVLAAKRRAGHRDAGLEGQIAQLFQRLRTLQTQEANLIRGMIPSTRTSNVETGLAILKRVEQLREKYGDTSTTNPTAQGSDTTEA